ncbi:MAG: hypothetical protein ACRC7Q_06645, partial [Plesiomonas shigelloides]
MLYRVGQDGQVVFYNPSGELLSRVIPELPAGVTVVSARPSVANEQSFALGLSNGELALYRIEFGVTYPQNVRTITPRVRNLSADAPLVVNEAGKAIEAFAFGRNDSQLTVAFKDTDGIWQLVRLEGAENLLTEEIEWHRTASRLPDAPGKVEQQLMTPDQRQLMLRSGNKIYVYDIQNADDPSLLQVIDGGRAKQQLSSVSLLSGASSLLLSYRDGELAQYFRVNGPKGRLYQEIREFKSHGTVTILAPEFYRKSFATVTEDGRLSLLYTTSERELLSEKFDIAAPQAMGFNPRANGLVVDAGNKLHLFAVENDHPEMSWSALWHKVWYE